MKLRSRKLYRRRLEDTLFSVRSVLSVSSVVHPDGTTDNTETTENTESRNRELMDLDNGPGVRPKAATLGPFRFYDATLKGSNNDCSSPSGSEFSRSIVRGLRTFH